MHTVSFFNHKGGVGKTTLVFNIGVALSAIGRKVLFVDLDPQANLTTLAINPDKLEQLVDSGKTIRSCLRPIIDGSGDVTLTELVQIREQVWILPGDIALSDFEEIAPQGWTEALAGNIRGFRVSTALFRLVQRAAREIDADYALLDLGPNVGSMNRTALLASTGFVVPLAPDLFSLSALPSVGKSTSLWVEEWRAARGSAERRQLDLDFELPRGEPSPLGYLSQQFSVYRQQPAAAYKRWSDKIPSSYSEGITIPLSKAGIAVPPGDAKLGEVRNLSSLIPIAQRTNQAVFELSGIEARGAQHTRARDTYDLFNNVATNIEERLTLLTSGRADGDLL